VLITHLQSNAVKSSALTVIDQPALKQNCPYDRPIAAGGDSRLRGAATAALTWSRFQNSFLRRSDNPSEIATEPQSHREINGFLQTKGF